MGSTILWLLWVYLLIHNRLPYIRYYAASCGELNPKGIKLRKAFGDSSRHPQFIKTIPKTGYQLIAKVEQSLPEPTKSLYEEMQNPEKIELPPSKHRKLKLVTIGMLLLITLAVWQRIEDPL